MDYQIYPFKVYMSVDFSIFMELYKVSPLIFSSIYTVDPWIMQGLKPLCSWKFKYNFDFPKI